MMIPNDHRMAIDIFKNIIPDAEKDFIPIKSATIAG